MILNNYSSLISLFISLDYLDPRLSGKNLYISVYDRMTSAMQQSDIMVYLNVRLQILTNFRQQITVQTWISVTNLITIPDCFTIQISAALVSSL